MPNIKSAKKRVLTNEKRRVRNKMHKGNLKSVLKKAHVALTDNKENAAKFIKEAISTIDKSVSKGILHKNNASRKKSKLMKQLNNVK